MQIYTQNLTVSKEDLDELNHVNNIKYVEWIQEISKEHWHHATDESIRNEMVWVVKSHQITYKKSAHLGDVLTLSTCIKGNKGPLSFREVEIKNNKTGQVIVYAITEWCLLDAKTLRPKRVPEQIQNLFS